MLSALALRLSSLSASQRRPPAKAIMAPITIWGSDTTRSDLIKASCAELGLDYTFVALDWNAKEHKGEAFLKVRRRVRLRGSAAPTARCACRADAAPRGRSGAPRS